MPVLWTFCLLLKNDKLNVTMFSVAAKDVFKLLHSKYKKFDLTVGASFFEIYSGKVSSCYLESVRVCVCVCVCVCMCVCPCGCEFVRPAAASWSVVS